MKNRLGKPIAVVACMGVLVLGFDTATYAATGSSLILGKINSAGATTTVSNTGTGPAMRLVTKSSSSAPFSTNAKGMVGNLNSQFLAGQSLSQVRASATRLGGKTASEIIAAANKPWISFNRTDAPTQSYNLPGVATFPAVRSASGALPSAYDFSGTVTFPCVTVAGGGDPASYFVQLFHVTAAEDLETISSVTLPPSSCGSPAAIPAGTATLTADSELMVMVYGNALGSPSGFPGTLTFTVTGYRATSAL